MGYLTFIHTLVFGALFAVLAMVLADGAPVDIVDSNSGNMPSTSRAALTGGADDAAVDLNTSSQPMFENLNTDFSKALMPCPDKPMDPRFGPGPVCQPQHGKD